MRISTRNQIPATITQIQTGSVDCLVSLELGGKVRLDSVITMLRYRDLGISVGEEVIAVFSSFDLLFSLHSGEYNSFEGVVAAIKEGAACTYVAASIDSGDVVSACVPDAYVKMLGYSPGDKCLMRINPFDVSIAIE